MRQTLRRTRAAFLDFFRAESAGSALLLGFALLALLLENSPLRAAYEAALAAPLCVGAGALSLTLPLEHWVTDGLMTLFFLTIGLEVKREFLYGELRTPTAMLLPVCAALAGMAVPALLFAAATTGTAAAPGWGIPMATDIAFALGVLRLVAPAAPLGLVVFLTALAIVDDLGAIVVIALFYSKGVSLAALFAGLAALALAAGLGRYVTKREARQRRTEDEMRTKAATSCAGHGEKAALLPEGVRCPVATCEREALPRDCHAAAPAAVPGRALLPLFALLGAGAWLAFHKSGIHPTLAGVLLGLALPAHHDPARSLLHWVEARLAPVSSYLVMPAFALVSAGVPLRHEGELLLSPLAPATRGIALGLVLGKPLGIYGSVRLITRLFDMPLPGNARPRELLGAACLAGIGFTMSIFIAGLAFAAPEEVAIARLSVLAASLLAAALGTIVLRWSARCR